MRFLPQYSSDFRTLGDLQTIFSVASEELDTKFSNEPIILALENFREFSCHHPFSPGFFWAVGYLPLLIVFHGPLKPKCCSISSVTASSRPIQAHATTRALIPHYKLPDPMTGEEDGTNTKHMGKHTHEQNRHIMLK